MLTWLNHFFSALLWDEAAAQRYLVMLLFLGGEVLTTGGTVPGTSIVLPGLDHLYAIGPYMKAAAFFLGAGSMLPAVRAANGGGKANGSTTPAPPTPPTPAGP